jgi:hypothetical protein
LRDELFDLWDDVVLKWLFLASLVGTAILTLWMAIAIHLTSGTTVAISVIGMLVMFYCACQIKKSLPLVDHLRLGISGEVAVAEALDELRSDGCITFHDVCQKGFNIDHVVIGPGGVFVLETKTASKPVGRNAKVVFDGEKLLVDGYVPDRDPIVQVKAAARRITEILERSTGQSVRTRPVVVYPGWYTVYRSKPTDCWVLNETAAVKWIRNERQSLSVEEIRRYSEALSTYVRATSLASS